MHAHEVRMQRLMNSVYDGAAAYSLRDRDLKDPEIEDLPPVVRLRLNCRAAENLLFTNDVLAACGVTWPEVEERLAAWSSTNEHHPRREAVQSFLDAGSDRMNHDLKSIRLVVVGHALSSEKPWEVLVGQAVALADGQQFEHSMRTYLGEGVWTHLLGQSAGELRPMVLT